MQPPKLEQQTDPKLTRGNSNSGVTVRELEADTLRENGDRDRGRAMQDRVFWTGGGHRAPASLSRPLGDSLSDKW